MFFRENISNSGQNDTDGENVLQLQSSVEKWRRRTMPEKVGTVKVKYAIMLGPMQEHLVWGRLPRDTILYW